MELYEISPLRFTPVEMTYKEVLLLDSLPLIIKQLAICFLNISNKIFNDIILIKKNSQHIIRSKASEVNPVLILFTCKDNQKNSRQDI